MASRQRRHRRERILIVAVILLSPYLLTAFSQPKPKLGLTLGFISACNGDENCVSTSHWSLFLKDPIRGIPPVMFEASPQLAWQVLQEVVAELSGTTIIEQNGYYLHAERRSPVYRFVDDLEFRLYAFGKQGAIGIRAASRLGYTDFGRNRRTVARLTERFQKELARRLEERKDQDPVQDRPRWNRPP